MSSATMTKIVISLMLIGSCSLALAYEKEGNVITPKTVGGAVAVDTSTPNATERTAAPGGGLQAETAAAAPVAERAITGKTGKTKRTETVATGGESPQAYTSGGGVQSPGGVKSCHVRGFKDPTGLIHDDHYQKCGTIINGMTSQCYADGRCRISY